MAKISTFLNLTLLVSGLFFAACATTAPDLPLPLSPESPKIPLLEKLEIPTPPQSKLADLISVQGTPAKFPVKLGDMMVLSIPAGVMKTEGTEVEDENINRFSLIQAFLSAGFRVKDAGIVQIPQLVMRKQPATQTEKSRVIETDQALIQKDASRDMDWQNNAGLTVSLQDPTSLWANELLQYSSLKADYYLRLFRYDAGIGNSKLPRTIDQGEYEAYKTAVETYNLKALEQKTLVEDYQADQKVYGGEFESFIRNASEYNSNRAKNAVIPIPTRKILPDIKAPQILKVPSVFELIESQNNASDIRWVYLLGELISVQTGEVIWTGQLSASGLASQYSTPVLMTSLIKKLTNP